MIDVADLQFKRGRPKRKRSGPTNAQRRRAVRAAEADPAIVAALNESVPAEPLPAIALRPEAVLEIARVLEPVDRMAYFAALDERTERQMTFEEWVEGAHPGYVWGPHLRALALKLQDVADGLCRFLMAFMPPRHGKSEIISRLFTAYYLYRHGKRDVAITTYGSDLSYDLSRAARDNFVVMGGRLAADATAVKSWHTAEGGNLWATGVGGPATGRGFHLGIIDDPYKDHEEANSAKIRRTRWNWYKAVFLTRAAPGAAIVILLTRWHMDDLVAGLLREEEATRVGWHVMEFPAEKRIERQRPQSIRPSVLEALEEFQWPSTVTVSPDVRDHARWLWTARFSPEEYEARKRAQGGDSGYFWNALFQQRPRPTEGKMFRREWFTPIRPEDCPPLARVVRWWDLAASEGEGNYTAGVKIGKTREPTPRYVILGLAHGQWHPGNRDNEIVRVARDDGPDVKQLFPKDPGAAGKQVADEFITKLSGISPVGIRLESGSKETRATLAASDASNGRFLIIDAPFAAVVLQELADFGPGCEFDDIVDSVSGGHADLATKRGAFVA